MKRAADLDPIHQLRRLTVVRVERAFALSDYPAEPISLLRIGANDTTETLALFGAPKEIESFLERAKIQGQAVVLADLTFEV